MQRGKEIKIIKRAEAPERRAALTEKSGTRVQNSGAMAKRDAVTVVNGWVQELRRKKIVEATRRFESLFHRAA